MMGKVLTHICVCVFTQLFVWTRRKRRERGRRKTSQV